MNNNSGVGTPPSLFCLFQSSNGVYVGSTKIPRLIAFEIKDGDIIGVGWTTGAAPPDRLKDEEKYIFKLTKQISDLPKTSRIQFKSENKHDKVEENIAAIDSGQILPLKSLSPVLNLKSAPKRKIDLKCDEIKQEIKREKKCPIVTIDDDIVNLLTDSDHESPDENNLLKNLKFEPTDEINPHEPLVNQIKSENEFLEYEAFHVKQEYMGYDDEPIKIDSDSDSESEHWYMRLSQNSPGKPFSKVTKNKPKDKSEDSSYSQIDDNYVIDLSFTDNECPEEEFMDDIISIPTPHEIISETKATKKLSRDNIVASNIVDIEEFPKDIISLQEAIVPEGTKQQASHSDEVDGFKNPISNQTTLSSVEITKIIVVNDIKKTQMIEPQFQFHKGKSSKYTSSKSMF